MRGSNKHFPAATAVDGFAGWCDDPSDSGFVCYWSGSSWASSSESKELSLPLAVGSFVIWWGYLAGVVFALGNRWLAIGVALGGLIVIAAWVLIIAWALRLRFWRVLWKTFSRMVFVGW
jgi:hypothetical protein